MVRKFNPLPGWPAPPTGWVPPPGWQPPASLPTPPVDWRFWIDDTTVARRPAAVSGDWLSRHKLVVIEGGALGLALVGCFGLAAIVAAVGPKTTQQHVSSASRKAPRKSPSATVPAVLSPVSSSPARTYSVPASAAPTSPSTRPPTVASQADRAAAAKILSDNVNHYRQVFHQGQAIIGHTQYPDAYAGLDAMNDPDSAAARFRDYRQSPDPVNDLSYQSAFAQADEHFTADNEPQEISKWRDDMGTMSGDLYQWVNVAVSYKISGKTQADLDAAATKVEQDLDRALTDVRAIAGG
jgi:hypothetical protein